ncbi:MAG: proton-conducting membrane transporter [Propionibacterium sp.]|nr:proton-conducting membrane transporter [Propionibacterium sp.]
MAEILGTATGPYRSVLPRRWDWFGDRTMIVTDVALACCALEFEAAGAEPVAADEEVDHLPHAVVVSGTVTDALAPAVVAMIEHIRARTGDVQVVSFGACTATGGPYWDSPVVTKGLDQLVPVARYVAGCPPPPGALTAALADLRTGATC